MIFSNHKNVDNNFTEVVASTLESLHYLVDRLTSAAEKIQNPKLVVAKDCIHAMQSGIKIAIDSRPTQTLQCG